MRKWMGAGAVGLLMTAMASSAQAGLETYSETLNLNQGLSNFLGFIGGNYSYAHTNPWESQGGHSSADWNAAVAGGKVTEALLTLDMSGMGGGERLRVEISPVGGGWVYLGEISGNTAYTYNLLDPSYGLGPGGGLDGLPVGVRLTGIQGFALGGSATLSSSTLRVTAEPVPVPAAAWMAIAGFGVAAAARRRLTRAA